MSPTAQGPKGSWQGGCHCRQISVSDPEIKTLAQAAPLSHRRGLQGVAVGQRHQRPTHSWL